MTDRNVTHACMFVFCSAVLLSGCNTVAGDATSAGSRQNFQSNAEVTGLRERIAVLEAKAADSRRVLEQLDTNFKSIERQPRAAPLRPPLPQEGMATKGEVDQLRSDLAGLNYKVETVSRGPLTAGPNPALSEELRHLKVRVDHLIAALNCHLHSDEAIRCPNAADPHNRSFITPQ